MFKKYFHQHRIGEIAPPNWDGSSATTIQLFLTMNEAFGIEYTARTVFPPQPNQPAYETDLLDFGIWTKYVLVEIYLMDSVQNLDWRWSTRLDAFTTKDSSRKPHYGHLQYKKDASETRWIPAKKWVDGKDLYRPAKVIQFKAKQKGGGTEDYHAFSLNLEVKQSDGHWLPITIDPDVRNPPTLPDPIIGENLIKIIQKQEKAGEKKFRFFASKIVT